LLNKYQYFLVNDIDTHKLDDKLKNIVGLQAIEMMIACQDDRWGVIEDSILKIPSTMENGPSENKILFISYKKKLSIAVFRLLSPRCFLVSLLFTV